ncbi:MAG: peptidyl-tRNA hydrolase [Thermoprotei archaeon]|nr:MAG: peptidyl-tRNA hydrolase [Thermoprotei archaeon]
MSGLKYKQVIVVRDDIGMSKGKLAVQVAHASVVSSETARKERKEWWKEWWKEGQKKVVLKVKSEEELIEIYTRAKNADLPVSLITDMGLTEIPPGTRTAVGIGPAPEELIDRITGHLKLLR